MAGWNEKHLIWELGILRTQLYYCVAGSISCSLFHTSLLMGRIIELLKINADRLIKGYIFLLFTHDLLECDCWDSKELLLGLGCEFITKSCVSEQFRPESLCWQLARVRCLVPPKVSKHDSEVLKIIAPFLPSCFIFVPSTWFLCSWVFAYFLHSYFCPSKLKISKLISGFFIWDKIRFMFVQPY